VYLPQVGEKATSRRAATGDHDAMDVEDESASQDSASQNSDSQGSALTDSTHFSQSDDRKVKKDIKDVSKIDFAKLKGEYKQRLNSDKDEN
jgi:hypothetical protein